MNKQFDVIIIGDSKHGNLALKQIAKNNPKISIAFISKQFKQTTTHDYLNVEYIQDEVKLIDFKNRLYGCFLAQGGRLYSTHLIIASGLKYEPLWVNHRVVPNVYHNLDEIPTNAKNEQAICLCSKETDVKFAFEIAKKYKYVYLCMEDFDLKLSPKTVEKLCKIDNIVVLPNTQISKVTLKDRILNSVELSNYSSITSSAIYVKTASTPDVSFVPSNIFIRDEAGYLQVKNNLESTAVPKSFAVGTCVKKCSKIMLEKCINSILEDFN